MTRVLRSLIATSQRNVSQDNARHGELPVGTTDTYVHVKPDEKIARELLIHAGEKIFEQLLLLQQQQDATGTVRNLNRSAEMENTSSNPQLGHRSKITLLSLMKQVFGENESLSLIDFRKRLESIVLEKTGHFLGFEFDHNP